MCFTLKRLRSDYWPNQSLWIDLCCRAVEAARQAGRALEAEYGWGKTSEEELLEPIFAELEPDARAYFTEELEDGPSAEYFDGYDASVERVSVAQIHKG
jgi:hypothetical protein